MALYELDPISDRRWPELLDRHPDASVFHTSGWLEALRRTYGYLPLAYTTSPPGQRLENGIVFCRVRSWLTGGRLVSLPFSDHCQPLAQSGSDLRALLRESAALAHRGRGYAELRPLAANGAGAAALMPFQQAETYAIHRLDLRPDPESLFRNFHKTCLRPKIRRAEREGLRYETGRSGAILEKFYSLLLLTRRRHRLPPQPKAWFFNLADCLGDKLTVRLLSKGDAPVASILSLSYKKTLVYKYGCSDARFHNLGGMPLLLWKAIQEGKEQGAEEFDLGRSDAENAGLIAFKDHLGAARSTLTYYRYPQPKVAAPRWSWARKAAREALALAPDPVLRLAGALLYKHAG